MKPIERRTPPIGIGYRAAREVELYAAARNTTPRKVLESLRLDRKNLYQWKKGDAPCTYVLAKLATLGLDMNYIIKGAGKPTRKWKLRAYDADQLEDKLLEAIDKAEDRCEFDLSEVLLTVRDWIRDQPTIEATAEESGEAKCKSQK